MTQHNTQRGRSTTLKRCYIRS